MGIRDFLHALPPHVKLIEDMVCMHLVGQRLDNSKPHCLGEAQNSTSKRVKVVAPMSPEEGGSVGVRPDVKREN
jgi:hypothetical protein